MFAETFPREAVRGILFSQSAYWCTIILAVWAFVFMAPGGQRTAFILFPVIPAMGVVAVTFWIYRGCDEYMRLRILKSVAITALAMALFTLTFFLLELLGLPRMSAVWINFAGWSFFNLQMLYVLFRSQC